MLKCGVISALLPQVVGTIVLLFLLFLTPLVTYLPKTVLSAIVVVALMNLADPEEIKWLFKVLSEPLSANSPTPVSRTSVSLIPCPEPIGAEALPLLRSLAQYDRKDLVLWLVSFFCVLFTGVEIGILCAVGASFVVVLLESAAVSAVTMKRLTGTKLWVDARQVRRHRFPPKRPPQGIPTGLGDSRHARALPACREET